MGCNISCDYYLIDCTIQTGSFTAGDTFVVGVNPLNITNSTECVVQLDEGDTYYRMRRIRYGSEPNTFNYLVDYIESEEVYECPHCDGQGTTLRGTENNTGAAGLLLQPRPGDGHGPSERPACQPGTLRLHELSLPAGLREPRMG